MNEGLDEVFGEKSHFVSLDFCKKNFRRRHLKLMSSFLSFSLQERFGKSKISFKIEAFSRTKFQVNMLKPKGTKN